MGASISKCEGIRSILGKGIYATLMHNAVFEIGLFPFMIGSLPYRLSLRLAVSNWFLM